MYHPKSPYKVFCSPCWWSDKWDSKSYARNLDLSKPFFEQFKKLQLAVPRIGLLNKNSVNSEYTNHSGGNKNLFLSTDCFNCESSFYLSNCWNGTKNSCDVNMVFEGGEFFYECVSCDRSYKCQFCLLVHDSIECSYCFDCVNCQDCFLCSNQRNKKYCFLNEQLTKEEYVKRLQGYKFGSFKEREELYKKWLELVHSRSIQKYAQILQSENVSGDTIKNSRNIFRSYDIFFSDNVRYSVIVMGDDSMDVYSAGLNKMNLIYEVHALTNGSNISFSHLCYDNSFIEYCDSCHDSHNLFGCVGLRKAEYFIFNKQYTPEEYAVLKEKIIAHMKETGEYGEFFPPALSPFGYNETQGQFYMPMDRANAMARGFNWQDEIPITKGKETVFPEQIPDDIKDVSEKIINEALRCTSCGRNYNIVAEELVFYKKFNIPIPRLCTSCRYVRRINLRPPRKLWHRKCQCVGGASESGVYKNTVKHPHDTGHCPNEFETPYSLDRSEIVYCEQCYNSEIV
ncbi:hypothetical protein D4R51_03765 [bacterium]|nr:MAG: hypothetical protein D4R51_03765 [bacterium]